MLMQTSERLSTRSAAGFPLSPAMMMPNPKNSAMTMTWSIVALTKGSTAFDGKIFTRVSIREGALVAPSYASREELFIT